MAYTPTVWETGDVITAEKLNKAEQGIAEASAGAFYCHFSYADGTWTCDKTIAQIMEAYDAGRSVYAKVNQDEDVYIGHLSYADSTYGLTFFGYLYDVTLAKSVIFILMYTPEGITLTNEFVAS